MHMFIKHSCNLCNVSIPFYKCSAKSAELIPFLLIQRIVFLLNWQQRIGNCRLNLICFAFIFIKVNLIYLFNIRITINLKCTELLLCFINQVRIDFLCQRSLLIKRLKCFQNVFCFIDKINDECILFIRMGTVQSAEGLNRFYTAQFLIDNHGMKQWFIKSGLVFFRYNQNISFVMEYLFCLCFIDTIQFAFCPFGFRRIIRIFDRTRERSQNFYIMITLGVQIVLNLMIVTNRSKS